MSFLCLASIVLPFSRHLFAYICARVHMSQHAWVCLPDLVVCSLIQNRPKELPALSKINPCFLQRLEAQHWRLKKQKKFVFEEHGCKWMHPPMSEWPSTLACMFKAFKRLRLIARTLISGDQQLWERGHMMEACRTPVCSPPCRQILSENS